MGKKTLISGAYLRSYLALVNAELLAIITKWYSQEAECGKRTKNAVVGGKY